MDLECHFCASLILADDQDLVAESLELVVMLFPATVFQTL
jgi:hypothetical protein